MCLNAQVFPKLFGRKGLHCTYCISPKENLPGLFEGDADHMVQLLGAYTVGDVLNVRHGCWQGLLLGTDYHAMEVCIHQLCSETTELSDELTKNKSHRRLIMPLLYYFGSENKYAM